ncbi:3-phosphoshikimate 1-carboxyvinyltransferase [Candidatus Acetothermia bacterium]|nr:3-phosphoshikimate 1-carboxyvinyltransferase [Candidatus Acetothermia bacterium]
MQKVIKPAKKLRGTIKIPGDKSISHRALILGALAEGVSQIENLSPAQDVRSTAKCLQSLGASIQIDESEYAKARVEGRGVGGLVAPSTNLDAGNSGTTMRLLAGVLAGYPFTATLTGDESLRKRPMKRVIEPLIQMGALVESQNGLAPLKIHGGALHNVRYELPVASSQVKSAILLAGLNACGETIVIENAPTRDHTERMLTYLEAPLRQSGRCVSIQGDSVQYRARPIKVAGDISSAAFFLAAAALVPDSKITVEDVGLNPTRTGFLDVLQEMGVPVTIQNRREVCNEPWGNITAESASLKAVTVGGALVPRMIDELPMLAVLATQAQGKTVIRDAQELRVKETDRISAVAENLKLMGAQIEAQPDGWIIQGPRKLKGARVESYGDHRIVMAFAVAGLIAEGETVIEDAEWAAISFPSFFEKLELMRA